MQVIFSKDPCDLHCSQPNSLRFLSYISALSEHPSPYEFIKQKKRRLGMPHIAKACTIQGWMTRRELIWLGLQAQRRQCIVEVGSFIGRSTRVLGDNIKAGGKVYAIDDFFGPRKGGDRRPDGSVFTSRFRLTVFQQFKRNLGDLIEADTIFPIKCSYSGAKYLTHIRNIMPDFVFLDGSHEYTDVLRDIVLWRGRLVAGAILSGHDYDDAEVRRAIRDAGVKPRCPEKTNIWYCYG